MIIIVIVIMIIIIIITLVTIINLVITNLTLQDSCDQQINKLNEQINESMTKTIMTNSQSVRTYQKELDYSKLETFETRNHQISRRVRTLLYVIDSHYEL